jgi:hypothetical protein
MEYFMKQSLRFSFKIFMQGESVFCNINLIRSADFRKCEYIRVQCESKTVLNTDKITGSLSSVFDVFHKTKYSSKKCVIRSVADSTKV